jgi:ABC transporter with metal-binding/Fe-S-binding domain ATP-binding protein
VFAAYLMEQMGHTVDVLVNIRPRDPHSWVFHTPNLSMVPLMAEAMGKALIAADGPGTEEGDLAALAGALSGLEVEGVVTGAIASDYQWDRINHVCEALGLKVFSPLWRKDQDLVMEEMIDAGIKAVMVSVSAEGLDPSWLGREIDRPALEELRSMARRYGMNLAGEGGEYETMALDSPIHRQRIRIVEQEVETARDSGRLTVTEASLEERI